MSIETPARDAGPSPEPLPASAEGRPEPTVKVAGRIASLDGLRAVSILLVILSHAARTRGFPPMPALVDSLGDFGVRVFFVISGYLITALLLEEHARTGTISLRGFYTRRLYRIFPAFYAFLGVVLLLVAAGFLTLAPGDVVHAVSFTMNHHPQHAWWVGHLWSLSVEEQFYLLWPVSLLVLGVRRGLVGAAAVIALAPAVRVLTWRLFPESRESIGESFPTICDAIAVGCVLAGARSWLDGRAGYLRALRSPFAWLLPFFALAVQQTWRHPSVYLPFGHTAIDVSLALYIDRVVRFPGAPDGRFLNTAPLEHVGKLSYSIYLWQQLFLNRASDSPLCAFPLNVVLATLAALVSYHAVEQPFLRLRARRSEARRPASP